jgi:hypothetical protein
MACACDVIGSTRECMGRPSALACTRTHAVGLPGAAPVGLSGVRDARAPLLLNSALTASFAITAPLTATPDAQHATMAHLANHTASAPITPAVKRVPSTSRSMRCARDGNKHDLRVAKGLVNQPYCVISATLKGRQAVWRTPLIRVCSQAQVQIQSC